jgi:hypothetical protein
MLASILAHLRAQLQRDGSQKEESEHSPMLHRFGEMKLCFDQRLI